MRVAQRMISRNYKRQINSSMSKQSAALERSESGLAFKKLSDNVASGSRAMHLQEQRYASQQQLDNVKNLLAEQKSIDSNLSSIHSLLQKIQESVLKGMSEDWGESSRQVIATDIEKKMEQLLQFANAQYAGHTLFGGTNNSVPPFTVNPATGKLQFNGIDVDQIFKDAEDGKFYYYPTVPDSNHPDSGYVQFKYTLNTTTGTMYGDGTTFHLEGNVSSITYSVIDGGKYKFDGTDTYTDDNGKSFKVNGTGTGYDQVVINGVTYTKDAIDGYYYGEGFSSSNVGGRVFKSDNGVDFTEMDVVQKDPDDHLTMTVDGVKQGGIVKNFALPQTVEEPLEFKLNSAGGFDQVVINNMNYVRTEQDANGDWIYKSTAPGDKATYVSSDGLTFRPLTDSAGNDNSTDTNLVYSFTTPQKEYGPRAEVPNSGATFADIGLGLKIKGSDTMADPRTAYQVSFSGLDILGNAGLSLDGDHPGTIFGKLNGTPVSGNLYDLLGQIKDALYPDFDKNALDDLYTQLVDLTDNVGMVRTDLGNRMEYLELTETRLDEDIFNMTELESDLISSDPAMEAIKMKECEYVWLALMQLGSKVLPASLLDFMS